MAVERVDYETEDKYQQAIAQEAQAEYDEMAQEYEVAQEAEARAHADQMEADAKAQYKAESGPQEGGE